MVATIVLITITETPVLRMGNNLHLMNRVPVPLFYSENRQNIFSLFRILPLSIYLS
jgi:hypothetical protein